MSAYYRCVNLTSLTRDSVCPLKEKGRTVVKVTRTDLPLLPLILTWGLITGLVAADGFRFQWIQ